MAKLNFNEFLELIKLLRIDVFFLLAVFAFYMPIVTINQLSQDKYCINTFGVDENICMELEKHDNDTYTSILNSVLEKATSLKMYSTIIVTLPGIFFSFFLGYWVDAYPGHIRYLLAFGPISTIVQNIIVIYQCLAFDIEPMSLLYSYLPSSLLGSMVVILTGSYTYTTRKTPPKYRAIRFAILEFFLFISIPLSTTTGGYILGMKPWFAGQHRNYIGVFIVSIVGAALAALWVAILLNDADESYNDKKDESNTNDPSSSESVDNKDEPKTVSLADKSKGKKAIILEILNIRNVLTTFQTTFKKRDHNGRFCILFTMISMFICMIGYMGESSIGFQFAQRVYHWDASFYSYMSGITLIIPSIVTTITPPIMIHKFHLHDTTLGILGSFSLVLAMLVRGLILKPLGFFFGVIFGSFIGLSPIANRAVIARVIKHNEIGQIYALLSCIESAGPLVSSLFYSKIFQATIEDAPGVVYIAAAFLVTIPVINMGWLYFTKNSWDLVLMGEKGQNDSPTTETQKRESEIPTDQEDKQNIQVVANRVRYTSSIVQEDDENDIVQQLGNESHEEIIEGKVEIMIENHMENE